MTDRHRNWEDLNLLPVFAALLREGSTVRAGEQLGMTQSAVSRALARLRLWAKDELFVRSPQGMKPTPRALELAGPLSEALLNVNRAFDPKQVSVAPSTRFHLALTDYAAFLILPELVDEVSALAQDVRFRVRPNVPAQSFDQLDKGEVDLAIGPYRSYPTRFSSILLSEDAHICLLRKDHPLSRGKLTLERFLSMKHVLVTLADEERGIVDRALAQIGAKRERLHDCQSVRCCSEHYEPNRPCSYRAGAFGKVLPETTWNAASTAAICSRRDADARSLAFAAWRKPRNPPPYWYLRKNRAAPGCLIRHATLSTIRISRSTLPAILSSAAR